MRIAKTVACCWLLLATAGCESGTNRPGDAIQVESGKVADARQALLSWLECIECSNRELTTVVLMGELVEPSLEVVVDTGPSNVRMEARRRTLLRLHARLVEYRKQQGRNGTSISESEFVGKYLERYRRQYQERARVALAALRRDSDPDSLDSVLAQPDLSPGTRRELIDLLESER